MEMLLSSTVLKKLVWEFWFCVEIFSLAASVLNPLPSLSTPNIFHGKEAGDPQHNE
jgi:hypothetical protein